jgi:septin family protein
MTSAVTGDAIYRATFLTDEARKQEYYEAIVDAARRHPYFTVDQIWKIRGAVGDLHLGGRDNGSGMGPIMQVASNEFVIELVPDDSRPSQRPATHGKPERRWKSLIFSDGAPLGDDAIQAVKLKGAEALKAIREEKEREAREKAERKIERARRKVERAEEAHRKAERKAQRQVERAEEAQRKAEKAAARAARQQPAEQPAVQRGESHV